jgi:hypothetical protein
MLYSRKKILLKNVYRVTFQSDTERLQNSSILPSADGKRSISFSRLCLEKTKRRVARSIMSLLL